uniref:Variant surface glycoprotein 1125.5028 n=1 Tax=Trypanosoma brucei TaxID=5691 RepID=A0A1J0RBK8_9TRYP|nr:variant surface glycoprotein 1125.5028 [Trypanosoma brucei]
MAVWSMLTEQIERVANLVSGPASAHGLKGARYVGRLQGAVTEFLETQTYASAATKGCLQAVAGRTNIINAAAELHSAYDSCKLDWAEPTLEDTPPAVITKTGTQGKLRNGLSHDDTTDSSANTDCDTGTGTGTYKLTYGTTGHSVKGHVPKLAGGLLTVDTNGFTVPVLNTKVVASTASEYLGAAVKAANNLAPFIDSADINAIPALKSAAIFKDSARRYFLNKSKTEAQEDNSLPSLIEAAFNDDAGVKKDMYEAADNYPIPEELRPSVAQDKVGKINDFHNLMRLYFHFKNSNTKTLLDKIKKLQDAENQKKNPKPAEDREKVCNTKGKYKQEDYEKLAKEGCVFNPKCEKDKKRALSEESKQAVEKEEAAAATTEKCKRKLKTKCTKAPSRKIGRKI